MSNHVKYNIPENTKKYLAEKIGCDIDHIEKWYNFYKQEIDTVVKGNYLAHYIRALEKLIRDKTANQLFQIRCTPLPRNSKVMNVGTARYHKNECFIVYYHPLMNDIQTRDCLAHELGHLAILTLLGRDNQNINTEPIASALGIIHMLHSSHFYSNNACLYGERHENAIVDSFINITDRKRNIRERRASNSSSESDALKN